MLTTDQRNIIPGPWAWAALLNLQVVPGQNSGSWPGLQLGSHPPARSLHSGVHCGGKTDKVGPFLPAATMEETENCTVVMRQQLLRDKVK